MLVSLGRDLCLSLAMATIAAALQSTIRKNRPPFAKPLCSYRLRQNIDEQGLNVICKGKLHVHVHNLEGLAVEVIVVCSRRFGPSK